MFVRVHVYVNSKNYTYKKEKHSRVLSHLLRTRVTYAMVCICVQNCRPMVCNW